MKSTRLLPCLLAALLNHGTAPAQTAAWIAPGPKGSSADWNEPANWDTGTVPSGASATAVFNQATNAAITSPVPGGAQAVLTGNLTLGAVRFDLPGFGTTHFTGLTVGQYTYPTSQPAYLRLEGAGLDVNTPGTYAVTAVTLSVRPGSTLEFANQARISRSGFTSLGLSLFGAFDAPTTLRFLDDSSIAPGSRIGTSILGHVAIEFRDRARAGDWAVELVYNSSLNFFDDSSAQTASLTSAKDGNGAGVVFNDRATAAQATLDLQSVTFNGHATAGSATITNAGFQNYSSHGQYVSYFTSVTFNDDTTAAQATLSNNPFGNLAFHDRSSAGAAIISSQGTVNFSGASSFGSARLIAGAGSYMEGAGYNQSREVATGRVVFQDQATGGSGRIEISHANAVLDFSGLYTGTGTAGRAVLPATPTAPAVAPDDRVTFSLGSITNTAPGGTIHLGGTVLAIGADNRDMTLSARISDIGGSFGTATGAPLVGGTLQKMGTGILTLTNADAGYGVQVDVMEGTVRLDGGATGNAILSGSGRLTGNGTVRGHLANGTFGTGAMVSPGNSTGTITVTGNYTQSAGASLNMEIASATDHDRLVVDGSALLNGTLNVFFVNGYVPVGNTSIPLLTAGSATGSFSTVNLSPSLGAGLTATTGTVPGGLGLVVTQKPFAGFTGASVAGPRFGGYLDGTVATATGERRALLAGLNSLPDAAAIATALDALSPDRYAVLGGGATQAALAQQSARDRWLAAQRGRTGRGFDVFFEAGRRRGRFDATAAAPAASVRTDGGSAGALWHNDGTALALSVTQESGDLALDAAGSRAKLDSVVPVLSFQHAGERFFIHASAARASEDHEFARRIVYAGVDGTAVARPSAARTDFAFTVGRTIDAGGWTVTPAAGLLRSDWKMDAFNETGLPGANLAFSDWSARTLHARVLLAAAYRGHGFTPAFSLGWLHALTNDHSMLAGLDGAGSSYAVPARSEDKNLFQGRVSLEKRLGRSVRLTLAAGGAWGDDSRVTSEFSAGLRWEF